MKNLFKLFAMVFIAANAVNAQQPINLEITHGLNGVNSVLNTIESNNLGENFQITRLQYYVSSITVIHDGNQSLPISLDTIALINVADELVSTIPLGNLNVTNVEGVEFKIGVYAPVNNEDPTQWPSDHPLAPQNPSMHWGWASGYRFVAFEGIAGTNFSQMWQFHGLGNSNYFEVDPVLTQTANINGVETIQVEANYVNALEDLAISQGLISHGETGPAKEVLLNFSKGVFGVKSSLNVDENKQQNIKIFPNPSAGNITLTGVEPNSTVYISDVLGKNIETLTSSSSALNFNINRTGMFIVTVKNKNEELFTQRVIIK
ncbi:MAG: MbnP family protein [Lishizhenia sp.]